MRKFAGVTAHMWLREGAQRVEPRLVTSLSPPQYQKQRFGYNGPCFPTTLRSSPPFRPLRNLSRRFYKLSRPSTPLVPTAMA